MWIMIGYLLQGHDTMYIMGAYKALMSVDHNFVTLLSTILSIEHAVHLQTEQSDLSSW